MLPCYNFLCAKWCANIFGAHGLTLADLNISTWETWTQVVIIQAISYIDITKSYVNKSNFENVWVTLIRCLAWESIFGNNKFLDVWLPSLRKFGDVNRGYSFMKYSDFF